MLLADAVVALAAVTTGEPTRMSGLSPLLSTSGSGPSRRHTRSGAVTLGDHGGGSSHAVWEDAVLAGRSRGCGGPARYAAAAARRDGSEGSEGSEALGGRRRAR